MQHLQHISPQIHYPFARSFTLAQVSRRRVVNLMMLYRTVSAKSVSPCMTYFSHPMRSRKDRHTTQITSFSEATLTAVICVLYATSPMKNICQICAPPVMSRFSAHPKNCCSVKHLAATTTPKDSSPITVSRLSYPGML